MMTTKDKLAACSLISGVCYILLALLVNLSMLGAILALITLCITIVLIRTADSLFETNLNNEQKLWEAQRLIKDIRFNKYDKITQERVDNYLEENRVPDL